MANEKVWLVVKWSQGKEQCDVDEDDNEHRYMSWVNGIKHILVDAKELDKQIEKYSDADYDWSEQVLFVVDSKDNILVDFTAPRRYFDVGSYFKDHKRLESYHDAVRAAGKEWDRRRSEEVKMVMFNAGAELPVETGGGDF